MSFFKRAVNSSDQFIDTWPLPAIQEQKFWLQSNICQGRDLCSSKSSRKEKLETASSEPWTTEQTKADESCWIEMSCE